MILCCIGCAIFGVTDVPTDGIHFPDAGVVVDPLTKMTTNNNTTTTTPNADDHHHMNAAEMGTMKPNHTTNHPTTTTMPIIIPPPTDTILVTEAMAEDHAVVNHSMDPSKTTHQQADTTKVESLKESSDVHHNKTGHIVSMKDDTIVESVTAEKDAIVSSQSLTLPNVLPPSAITSDNNSHDPQQPQINELD